MTIKKKNAFRVSNRVETITFTEFVLGVYSGWCPLYCELRERDFAFAPKVTNTSWELWKGYKFSPVVSTSWVIQVSGAFFVHKQNDKS